MRNALGKFVKGNIPPMLKATDEQILRAYNRKDSDIDKIANRFNMTRSNLIRRLKSLGINTENKTRYKEGHTSRITHGLYYIKSQYKKLNPNCEVCNWEYGTDIHHILPLSKGGKDEFENLISLCPNHHRLAHKGLLDIFIENSSKIIVDVTKKELKKEGD